MTEPPVGLAGDALLRYWDIRDAHDSLAGQVGHEDIEPGQVLHNDVIALAAQQPFYAHSGGPAFPDPFQKAAVAVRIIAQRHPFGQGNKRTAWLYAVTLLGQLNFKMPEDVAFDYVRPLIVAVSRRQLDDVDLISSCLGDFFMGRYGAIRLRYVHKIGPDHGGRRRCRRHQEGEPTDQRSGLPRSPSAC